MKKFFVLCGAVFFGANIPISAADDGNPINSGYRKAAEQMNKTLPKMIGDNLRMDRAAVDQGLGMSYYHTITNRNALDVPSMELRSAIYPQLRDGVCSNSGLRKSLQDGAIYNYIYSGMDGAIITRVTIDRSSCIK